ncbi:hypothetical protein B0F90DRAFT_1920685 [Multifurca ochricompacta]|uniref:CFEM domain-containing protein n=1 Tax=Multifurca ochricompacta TaxID=376703 RepID=A0AAD4LVP3_9AGAM|nr:hypothetical protein B0F90DRAFT_1920685 [Multifurca ochricompacta]
MTMLDYCCYRRHSLVALFFLILIFSSFGISLSQAQTTTTTTPPASACGTICAESAAITAGCDATNVTCLCASPIFLQAADGCIMQTCAASDAQTAAEFLSAICMSSPGGQVSSFLTSDANTVTFPSGSNFATTTIITRTISPSRSIPSIINDPSRATTTTVAIANATPTSVNTYSPIMSTDSSSTIDSAPSRTPSTSSRNGAWVLTTVPTNVVVAALLAGGIGAFVVIM